MKSEEIPPHLSAEEHALVAVEEELLRDGRQWLSRALELYTRTSKIKIWVPVVASVIMTTYYLYLIHARTSAAPEVQPTAVQAVPVAVAVPRDETPHPLITTRMSAAAVSIPDSPDPAATTLDLVSRAQDAHANQRFAEEAAFLQQALNHSHTTQMVCPAIGKAYEQAGDMAASLKAFKQCLSHDEGNVETLLAYAHALQQKPDYRQALETYRQCLRRDPNNTDAANGVALVELRQNHLPEADQAARSILSKNSKNPDALLIVGLVAWRQAKLDEAQQAFLKGIALDDHRADFHGFLGRVQEAQGHPSQALEQYEKALAIDPNDSDIAERTRHLKGSR